MLTNKQMQKNLKYYKNYYTGEIDGIVGTLTKTAVKKFQKEYGLVQDGIYGTKTDGKLVSVVKQCQKAAGATADGIIGPDTISAVKRFQKKNGLTADGIIGTQTLRKMNLSVAPQADAEVNWSEVKYFEKAEFKCDCNGKYCDGYPAEIDVDLVELLEKARTHYGKAMQITSGLRCKKRNAELAVSSPVSKHLEGKAADVWIVGTAANNAALVKWFQAQPEVNYSYTGFGAVHVDVK